MLAHATAHVPLRRLVGAIWQALLTVAGVLDALWVVYKHLLNKTISWPAPKETVDANWRDARRVFSEETPR